MLVELIYERTCPNIESARAQLLNAFAKVGATPRWQEWEVSAPDAPAHVHGYGSPTILVNGCDVIEDIIEGDDYCCRVYSHQEGSFRGVPAVKDIVQAMQLSHQPSVLDVHPVRLPFNSALLPAISVALLPKLVCPACWPAYAGLLSSLGIGFVDYTPYLLPLTAVFLLVAIAALTYGAEKRHGYKPLQMGVVASGVLLIGKFYFDSDVTMYVGLFLLVSASIWNTWPKLLSAEKCSTACEVQNQKQERA